MRCVIIEDEDLAVGILEDYISKFHSLDHIASYRNPIEAIAFVNEQRPDLLFLDINMPDLTGLEFLENISYKPYVIFTTAYADYALKSFDYNTLDYLLKPIRFERFAKAVSKAQQMSHPSQQHPDREVTKNHTFVKNSNGTHKIDFDKLVFVESFRNYVQYHLTDKTIEIKESISRTEKDLPNPFVRVHRSYIINTQFMQSVVHNHILLSDNIKIPVGRSYKSVVQRLIHSASED